MAITPEQARAELDRRGITSSNQSVTAEQAKAELARRGITQLSNIPKEAQDNENLLQKFIRYGIKDPAVGLLNASREFVNAQSPLSSLAEKSGGKIPEIAPTNYDFGAALGIENPNSGDTLAQMVGQYAPSMALPGANLGKAGRLLSKIPGIGKYASKAASEAIPQALYSASQSPDDAFKAGAETGATMLPFSVLTQLMESTSPAIRTTARVLAGAGTGLLGREGAKAAGTGETFSDLAGVVSGALGARGFNTTNQMMRELTEGVSPKIANRRIAAANRLGLDFLTPAEAGVSPRAARKQGSLGRTPEGGEMLYEKGIARRESEKRAIDKTLDMIYAPEKMDKYIEGAYKAINDVNLPKEFPMQFQDNEIIKAAKNIVENTPAYKESLKDLIPKNAKLEPGQTNPQATSLMYWDHIKRAMDDMVNKAERTGDYNEARIISNTRANMRNQMDVAFPEYQAARALYERKMVRQGLEKVFDQKEVNGTNFYRALASQKKFDEILGHLKNAPEAAQNLKDMRLLFNDLMGPPTIKTAKGTEERGMNQMRNKGSFLEHLLEHAFTRGGNDKAAIEFITSKEWGRQMKDIEKISDKHLKALALAKMLSKGVSQAVGQQQNNAD